MGGIGFGALGGINGSGFSYFTSNHPLQNAEEDNTPVDADALADPHHVGHREAIKTLSHVDDDKHEKITQWLKDELDKIEGGSAPPK